MPRSNFPQTEADRVAVAVTMAAVIAIVWLIAVFAPNPRDVSIAAVHTIAVRHVEEGTLGVRRDAGSTTADVSGRGPVS